ncbi:MAG: hypothetical protein ACTIA6_10160 [Pseudoclavibacter sp.]
MIGWVGPEVAIAIAAGFTAVGAIFGHATAARSARRADAQTLVDQLQEELATYREQQAAIRASDAERLNRLDTYVDGYRTHAHELRAHIWDGKEPPPPEWPSHLPK